MQSIRNAVAVFLILASQLVAVPAQACIGQPCEDPPGYYEVLNEKPTNWLDHYVAGDWVWIKTTNYNNTLVDSKWYVMPDYDPNWFNQPHACCSNGPWYITSEGGLYLIW
jgi:hypothetical protein